MSELSEVVIIPSDPPTENKAKNIGPNYELVEEVVENGKWTEYPEEQRYGKNGFKGKFEVDMGQQEGYFVKRIYSVDLYNQARLSFEVTPNPAVKQVKDQQTLLKQSEFEPRFAGLGAVNHKYQDGKISGSSITLVNLKSK